MAKQYAGRYRVRGHQLRREDGLILLIVERRYVTDPAKGDRYILDKSHPSGKYVSSVWGDEFEHDRTRYRINWIGSTAAEIVALRKSKRKTRPPSRPPRHCRGPLQKRKANGRTDDA